MTPIETRVAVLTLLNGLVAAGILFVGWTRGRPRRRRTQFAHLLIALAAVGGLGLIELRMAPVFDFTFFGLVRLVYVQLVVLLPILGALLLVHRIVPGRRGRGPMTSRAVMGAAIVALCFAPLGIYASFIEPYWLEVRRVVIEMPSLPAGERPIRVGVLADIQTTRITQWERRAVAALMAESPDLILITGDLLQVDDKTFATEAPAMRELLRTLHAPSGVFAVEGDCDPRGRTRRLYIGTGVKYLVNNIAESACHGRKILIGGCERDFESRPSRWMLGKLAERDGENAVRIVMSHDPAVVREVAAVGAADLVVAGHTHGGQVRLPGIGPLVTATTLPRRNCVGLSEYEGVTLYVSRGVGMERSQSPPIRFLCRPEVTVLELRGASQMPGAVGESRRR